MFVLWMYAGGGGEGWGVRFGGVGGKQDDRLVTDSFSAHSQGNDKEGQAGGACLGEGEQARLLPSSAAAALTAGEAGVEGCTADDAEGRQERQQFS